MTSDRFDQEQMFQWIKDQVSMGARRAGSAADRQNEDYIEAHLRDFGLEKVRREPIPITHWAAQTHSVEIDDGSGFKRVDAFPIPYSAFTAPEGKEARLVFADRDTLWHRADWEGAIVVTEIGFPELDVKLLRKFSLGQYDPDGSLDLVKHPATWVRLGWHLYHLAAKRGAVGFIGIVKDQPGGSCHMYAPYGFREKDILDKPIPGFWVGRAEASWLRKAAESGAAKARLCLAGIREPATMHNIVGEVPGASDETIVLTCHHDSPFDSPVEDASGVAVVLALARYFAQHRALKRRLVVVLTAGHFYGSLGTRTFIEKHQDDVVKHTALEITIEHIAPRGHRGRRAPTGPLRTPRGGGGVRAHEPHCDGSAPGRCQDPRAQPHCSAPSRGTAGRLPSHRWRRLVRRRGAGRQLHHQSGVPAHRRRRPRVRGQGPTVQGGRHLRGLHRVDRQRAQGLHSAVDSRRYLYAMKLLKHVSRARTTFFGTRPVY